MASRVGIHRNKIADTLSPGAHHNEAPTFFLRRFEESKRSLNASLLLQHPGEDVPRGAPPRPVSERGFAWAECALWHRLRTDSALMLPTLHRFGHTRCPNWPSCEVSDDIEHLLWACLTCAAKRSTLNAAQQVAGRPHRNCQDLIFFLGASVPA